MHNFEPKIVDLTGFTNIGDTLMKKEFVYMGNTSGMMLLWPGNCDIALLICQLYLFPA